MRNLHLVIKKKWLLVAAALLLVVPILSGTFAVRKMSSPKPEYTIVIDAGHGGIDVK